MNEPTITITLTKDQALVLCNLINRWDDEGKVRFECVAEYLALTKIGGQLDKCLVEPFRSDYGELLLAAQKRVGDGYEGEIPWG